MRLIISESCLCVRFLQQFAGWAWRGALDRKPGAHRLHIQWIPPPGSGDAPGCAAANQTYRHEPPARCRQQACAAKFKVLAVSSC